MLLFLPALYAKGIKLVERINKHIPGVKVLGGADISGQSCKVTKTNENYILQIDGKNSAEWYSNLLDKDGKIYYPNQILPIAKKYNLYEILSVVMVKKVMELFADSNECVTINLNVRDLYDRGILFLKASSLE